MKILIFNYEYPPLGGGGGVACQQIAEELAKRHEIHVFTTALPEMPRHETIHKVKIHRVPVLNRKELATATLLSMLSFFPMSFYWGLKTCLRIKPDIINAQFVVPSGISAFFLAKMLRIPFVLSLIGGDIYDPTKGISPHRHFILRKIIRFIANRADSVTAISSDTKKRAIKYHHIGKDIKIILLGLAPFHYKKVSRKELGLKEDVFYLVTVGRLIPRKGYDYLIKALAKIKEMPFELLIIGEGPQEKNLKNLAKELGIAERIRFLGYVSEEKKYQYLSCGNLFVSSSLHEGFGIVFLEAMYCGLPIVCSFEGGQVDFLKEGKNALLVPPEDDLVLSQALKKVITSRDLQKTMQENNLKDVEKYYIQNTAANFEKLFEEVTKK